MPVLCADKQQFANIMKEKGLFVIEFFATWCGPCKMLSPVLDRLAEKYAGEINVVKVDIDKWPELAGQYSVSMVPAVFFVIDGQIEAKEIGFIPYEKLAEKIEIMLYGKSSIQLKNDKEFELIIIGSGIAGMTAAIYAGRAGLKTALLEELSPGGNMIKTYEIQNWPGIKSTDGVSLAVSMFEHATEFGIEYIYGKVTQLKDGKIKRVFCEDGRIFTAPAVIIASGTLPKTMDVPGEQEMIGRGVSFCAVCDGAFYRDKNVAVIGGGNSALEESLHLASYADKLTIIIRNESFKADNILQEQVQKNKKIEIIKNHVAKEVLIENDKLIGLLIEDVKTGRQRKLQVDGVFPYIGDNPVSGFAQNLGITDERGYIQVNQHMQTKIAGIYAAGDVCEKVLKQLVTASNDGAIAAQNAFHYLRNEKTEAVLTRTVDKKMLASMPV